MRNFFLLSAAAWLLASCSFDYGDTSESDKNKPDIVMEDINYVRVRGGDPLARFKAEHAERFEERQIMEIRDFSFEQLQKSGEEVNAEGRAGMASVQLDSGDISLRDGVRINIESEDIIINTGGLEWKDKEKKLSGNEEDEVFIERSDGTTFTGIGFSASFRNRTWTFSGEVKGTYVEKDEDEKSAEDPSDTGEEKIPAQREKPAQPLPAATQPLPVTEKPLPVPAQPATPTAQTKASEGSSQEEK